MDQYFDFIDKDKTGVITVLLIQGLYFQGTQGNPVTLWTVIGWGIIFEITERKNNACLGDFKSISQFTGTTVLNFVEF